MLSFRCTIAALAVVLSISTGALAAETTSAPKALTTADVEQIVHDYIMKNPEVILTAVDDYQKKSQRQTQGAALEKNKDAIFNDTSSPIVGNPKGDVTIVEFMDYNCHYCKLSFPTVLSMIAKDKNLRVVMKDFPILGPTSETAAKWALAAQKQKKYLEFHKALMENKAPISDELLEKTATDTGLDVAQIKKDIQGSDILLQIEKNRSLASNLGLSGTPAFVIGDTVVFGAYSQEEMEKMVFDARAKKTAPADTAKPAAK